MPDRSVSGSYPTGIEGEPSDACRRSTAQLDPSRRFAISFTSAAARETATASVKRSGAMGTMPIETVTNGRLCSTPPPVLGVVHGGHELVEGTDDSARDTLGAIGRDDEDEVVTADVSHDDLGADALGRRHQEPSEQDDELVAARESVVVVELLEVVEVAVEADGARPVPEPPFDLGHDRDVPRQAGQRVEGPQAGGAPQSGGHPRHQLVGVKGFGHVVVGTVEKPPCLVRRSGLRGEEDHRDVTRREVAAERAMDVIAREVRHHDVEDDHLGRMSARKPQALDPVARADALIPGVTQRFDDDLADGIVVVDHQDALAHLWGIARISACGNG